MKRQNYRVVLSDGQDIETPAHSAADAMQEALVLFRGLRVTKCYRGVRGNPVMTFEIPPHSPVSEDYVAPRRRRVEQTETIFDTEPYKSEKPL